MLELRRSLSISLKETIDFFWYFVEKNVLEMTIYKDDYETCILYKDS
jgi:hypothetical protein